MYSTRSGKHKILDLRDALVEKTNVKNLQTSRSEPPAKIKKLINGKGSNSSNKRNTKKGKENKTSLKIDELFKANPKENKKSLKVDKLIKENPVKNQEKIVYSNLQNSATEIKTYKTKIQKTQTNTNSLNQGVMTDMENNFGFNDSLNVDIDLSKDESFQPPQPVAVRFDPSKPFRLALYMQPLQFRRVVQFSVNSKNNSTMEKETTVSKKNIRKEAKQAVGNQEVNKENVKKSKKNEKPLVQKKLTDMMVSKPATRNANKTTAFSSFFNASSNSSIFSDDQEELSVNSKSSRRSYVKRFKEKENTVEEPSTEEVLEDLAKKNKSKTRTKKPKENKEFEEWAKSLNSEFNDIDKFELTVLED